MQSDLGAGNVFLLHDDTNEPWTEAGIAPRLAGPKAPGHVFLFNKSECDDSYGPATDYWAEPALLLFLRQAPEFRHMWVVEEDVRCNGHWQGCLASASRQCEDLLCAMHFDWPNHVFWPHWARIEGAASAIPLEMRVACVSPIFRISRAALHVLRDEAGRSTGYLEVYFATLLKSKKLTISRLREDSLGIMVDGCSQAPGGCAGSAAYLKGDMDRHTGNNKLYHPVKD